MRIFLGIVVVVLFVGVLLWFFGPRIIKTGWLILKVSPFEQRIEDAPSILILGDSTGYGTGASAAQYSVAGLIGNEYPQHSIENNSVNGRTIVELEEEVKAIKGNYKLILLQIGGNDILEVRDVKVVEEELRRIVSVLSEKTESLVMISSGNVGGATWGNEEVAKQYEAVTRAFRSMVLSVAADTKLQYVDLFIEPNSDPFVLEPNKYLSIDGLHPSDEGYAFWYMKLQPVLARELEK